MIQISVQTKGPHGLYPLDECYRIIAEAGFDGVDAGFDKLFPGDDIFALKRCHAFDGTAFVGCCCRGQLSRYRYGGFLCAV